MNLRKFKYNKNKNEIKNDNYLGAKVKENYNKDINSVRGHVYSINNIQN